MIKKRINSSLFFLGLFVLIFLHYTKIISPLERLFFSLLQPFSSKFYYFSNEIGVGYDDYFSKNRSCRSNEVELRSENEKLSIENSKLKSLEDENKELRGYLNFSNKNKYRYAMANVISRVSDSSENQRITLDRGRLDGLREGLAVVSGDGVLVGKITEVKDNVSMVCLVIDKNCKIAVSLQNVGKTSGVSSGDFGLTVKINFVPQNEIVTSGDMVITSGLEKDIPRGLIVGKIFKVDKLNNEIWQNVSMEPMSRLDNLVIVSVLLP